MYAVSIVSIVKVIFGPVIKASRWVRKEAQLRYFGWRDREPPVNQVTALRSARSALGGNLLERFRAWKSHFIV